MKFTKKFGLAMIAICLMMSLASCQDDGVELTEEQFIQACLDGDADLVKKALKKNRELVNTQYKNQPIWFHALFDGNQEIVKLMIENGLDVNAKATLGPILKQVSDNGYKELAELLIKKGANVNEKDNKGDTALIPAAGRGHKDIVELLIKKGAKVNEKNSLGITALINAATGGHKDTVELLIKNKADVNAKMEDGGTVLMAASEGHGNKETVELLIANGADVNAKTEGGNTALMVASGYTKYIFRDYSYAKKGIVLSNDIVKLLISKGADVNARDKNGGSALIYAAANGELEIVKTLVENGANLTIKYDTGENAAIKIAQDNGHTEVAEYLKQQLANLPLSQRGDYIRVNNWNEVTLKKNEFLGKKVEFRTQYGGLFGDSGIMLLDGAIDNTFDKKLVDKIISLRDYSYYTFYGTVKEDWLKGVYLHIEEIE